MEDYEKYDDDCTEETKNSCGRKFAKIVGMVIGGIVLAVVLAFLFAIFVMWLWNWIMPEISDGAIKTIGFWEAFGVVLLAKLLFGGIGCKGHDHKDQKKKKDRHDNNEFNKIKREIKKEFSKNDWFKDKDLEMWKPKGSWKNWKYFEKYWKDEGKESFENYISKKSEDESKEDENKGNDKKPLDFD
jgi:hypothetical protein